MAFEQIEATPQSTTRRHGPSVCINSKKRLVFNASATTELNLNGERWAEIFYDKNTDQYQVAFAEEDGGGFFRVAHLSPRQIYIRTNGELGLSEGERRQIAWDVDADAFVF